jgi:hypothetical protein
LAALVPPSAPRSADRQGCHPASTWSLLPRSSSLRGSLEFISVGFPAHRSPADLAEYIVVDDSPCERLASSPVLTGRTTDPESWARFVGSYELPGGSLMPERTLHVDMEGQTLFLTFRAQRMRCLPISATTFACDAGVITFLETAHGIVLKFQRTMQASRVPSKEGEQHVWPVVTPAGPGELPADETSPPE